MGSCASVAAPASRQDLQRRENMKNRCNPTEPADQWRVKMLHDIGADPLAVIRDFPRMVVEVDTRVYGSASAAAAAAAEAIPRPSRACPASNPLVHSDEAAMSKSSTTTTTTTTTSEHVPRPGTATPHSDVSCALYNNNNNNSASASQPAPALHAEAEDAMAQRGRRVRRTVLQLSELCKEQDSFGRRFAAAWDAFCAQHHAQAHEHQGVELAEMGRGHAGRETSRVSEAQGLVEEGNTHIAHAGNNNNNTSDDDEGGEEENRLHGSAMRSSHRYSGLHPLAHMHHRNRVVHVAPDHRPGTRRARHTHNNNTTILNTTSMSASNACMVDVHQCMLHACLASGMLVAVSAEAATTLPANTQLAPSSSLNASAIERNASGTTPAHSTYPILANNNNNNSSSNNATATTAIGGSAARRMSVANRPAVNATMNTEQSQLTHLSLVPTSYHVRSATFHLMQYMTQGVMFYPVQRLQHVLWMSWSSHLQDIAWEVQVSCYEQPQPMRAPTRTHRLEHASNAFAAAAQASSHDSPALLPSAVAHAPRLAAASPCEAPAAPMGSVHSIRSTLTTNNNNNKGDDEAVVAGHRSTATGAAAASSISSQRVLVVRHLQTARHYVEKAARKSVPCYELDWACTIRIDADVLCAPYASLVKEEDGEEGRRGNISEHAMPVSYRVSPQASGGPSVTSTQSHKEHSRAHKAQPSPAQSRQNTADVAPYLSSPIRLNTEEEEEAETAGLMSALDKREEPPTPATRQTTTTNNTLPIPTIATTTNTTTTTTMNVSNSAAATGPAAAAAAVTSTAMASGVAAAQQPVYVTREVLSADVGVVAARVERPPRILGFTSTTWGRRKEEFEYVLENQYKIPLLDVIAHNKSVRGGISR